MTDQIKQHVCTEECACISPIDIEYNIYGDIYLLQHDTASHFGHERVIITAETRTEFISQLLVVVAQIEAEAETHRRSAQVFLNTNT